MNRMNRNMMNPAGQIKGVMTSVMGVDGSYASSMAPGLGGVQTVGSIDAASSARCQAAANTATLALLSLQKETQLLPATNYAGFATGLRSASWIEARDNAIKAVADMNAACGNSALQVDANGTITFNGVRVVVLPGGVIIPGNDAVSGTARGWGSSWGFDTPREPYQARPIQYSGPGLGYGSPLMTTLGSGFGAFVGKAGQVVSGTVGRTPIGSFSAYINRAGQVVMSNPDGTTTLTPSVVPNDTGMPNGAGIVGPVPAPAPTPQVIVNTPAPTPVATAQNPLPVQEHASVGGSLVGFLGVTAAVALGSYVALTVHSMVERKMVRGALMRGTRRSGRRLRVAR